MVKSSRSQVKSPRKRPFAMSRPRPQTATGASSTVVSAGNIKVVVRVRPPNDREQGDNHRIVVKVVDEQLLVFDPEEESQPFFYHGVQQKGRDLLKRANKNMQFIFDRVFGFDSTNDVVFEHSTKELISALMDGYNCSVFVYGATGAGKTHTMLGHNKNPGITFLTMEELFKQKQNLTCERDFELGVTYLEVYNENVQDLLNPGSPLHLREDGKYGVIVAGIQVKRIEEPSELFDLLEKGNRNRTQHPTDANAESSRSHAVFQVYLRMNIRSTGQVRVAKLSMIDLAGSERGMATGCAGARFTEGANINKSLLALGNCINSLADGNSHVPYRDSKLTRLLKDSLGGNCQTVMIANISPSSISYEDTYNTLKYATRAKKIKSNIKKNVVNCKMHVSQYVKMVEELNRENEKLKAQLTEKEELNKENERLKAQLEEKNDQRKPCGCRCNCNGERGGGGDATTAIIGSTVIASPSQVYTPLQEQACFLNLHSNIAKVQEELYDLMMSQQLLELKSQIRLDSNSRLSNLCVTSAEKKKGHQRLESAASRLQKLGDNLQQKIENLQLKKSQLQIQVDELLINVPDLKVCGELESLKLARLEAEHQIKLLQKVRELQDDELKKRGDLLENVTDVLKPCYLLLKGYNKSNEELDFKYRNLIKKLQGIDHVTWDEEVTDSGLSMHTAVSSTSSSNSNNNRQAYKRKYNNDHMDGTFILNPSKATTNVCADQINLKEHSQIVKKKTIYTNSKQVNIYSDNQRGFEPPPAKKVATVRSASPFRNKENKQPYKKNIGTMGTSSRFPSAKSSFFPKKPIG